MNRLLLSWKTYLKLGVKNLFFVFLYRLVKRSGFFRKLLPSRTNNLPTPLFHFDSLPSAPDNVSRTVIQEANDILHGNIQFFSNRSYFLGSPPDWFLNPISKKKFPNPKQHWSSLKDFDNDAGDIKCFWEVSRFDWAIVLSRAYQLSGEKRFLQTLNDWTDDWIKKNPSNIGPNWKCGQEVSIRMMQILLSAFLLGQHKNPTASLVQFVETHCRRISPTIYYAIAQNNNHGTSEAAALFVAGAWLSSLNLESIDKAKSETWKQLGRKCLASRVETLVEKDGSFSQYSLNYHRVMLDTLCYAEFWRILLEDPPFSDVFYRKAKAATKWLYIFTNKETGETPNLGANDGARFFNLSSSEFRDYRPTVQLASQLFFGKLAYHSGVCSEALSYLAINIKPGNGKNRALRKESTLFDDGGYCYLIKGETEVYIRYPRFKFRPGHADALHLDLWHRGLNIIRDDGSYSYNGAEKWTSYFSSTKAHSTVEFDGRNQMPKVSRFLFGDWLKTNQVNAIKNSDGRLSWSAQYKDYMGAEHRREVILKEKKLTILDSLRGFTSKGIVRWRLSPEAWNLTKNVCSTKTACLEISANVPLKRIELCKAYESRHYMEKSALPVLEVEVTQNAKILTIISLN